MNKYFVKAVENTKELVKIKSVKDSKKENMPFGEGIYKALNFFLELASSLGFETKNYDNYIGEVIFGEGKDEGGRYYGESKCRSTGSYCLKAEKCSGVS